MAGWVVILRLILQQSLRLSLAAVGFTVLGAGLVLLVTPGPGLLVITAGLAILARQFTWAERALVKARSRAGQAREAAVRRATRRGRSPGTSPVSLPPDRPTTG